MPSGHIKIKTPLSFAAAAGKLKDLLNVADQNRSAWQKDQERYGLNIGGGEYYLFEVLGLEIYLIKNRGEVEYFNAEWPYYITVNYESEMQKEIFNGVLRYIGAWLTKEGFELEIELALF